jgi:hypothetical protein
MIYAGLANPAVNNDYTETAIIMRQINRSFLQLAQKLSDTVKHTLAATHDTP